MVGVAWGFGWRLCGPVWFVGGWLVQGVLAFVAWWHLRRFGPLLFVRVPRHRGGRAWGPVRLVALVSPGACGTDCMAAAICLARLFSSRVVVL